MNLKSREVAIWTLLQRHPSYPNMDMVLVNSELASHSNRPVSLLGNTIHQLLRESTPYTCYNPRERETTNCFQNDESSQSFLQLHQSDYLKTDFEPRYILMTDSLE